MENLPPDGGNQLLDLYKQVPGHRKHAKAYTPLDELRHLMIQVSENWWVLPVVQ